MKRSTSKDSAIYSGKTMWALTNYGVVLDVSYRRRDCVAAGAVRCGGSEPFSRQLRRGVYDIRKVKVSARK